VPDENLATLETAAPPRRAPSFARRLMPAVPLIVDAAIAAHSAVADTS